MIKKLKTITVDEKSFTKHPKGWLDDELESGEKMSGFRKELKNLINKYSKENGSDTPDFMLADYLCNCLNNFDDIVQRRENWYGRNKPTEDLVF